MSGTLTTPVQTAAGRPWFDTLNIGRVLVVAFLGLAMGVQTRVPTWRSTR